MANSPNLRNKQIYLSTTDTGDGAVRETDYNLTANVYGDAIYEISTSYKGENGWCNDNSGFPYGNMLFFKRGGWRYSGSGFGIFSSIEARGTVNSTYYLSFRPVICAASSD